MPEYCGTAYLATNDDVLAAYLDTACWSSYHENDDEFYANDLSADAIKAMSDDLTSFLDENSEDIEEHTRRAAMNFWLSRNGHGTGFFDDTKWDPETRARLQKAAKAYGTQDLYRDENGDIQVYA